jgi:hypothetical protein
MDPSREPRSLAELVVDLRRRGFTEDFAVADGVLRPAGRRGAMPPEQVRIVEIHRFEGVSDPADMAILYALETRDGRRGILVDAFGTYSDPEVGEFVRRAGWR